MCISVCCVSVQASYLSAMYALCETVCMSVSVGTGSCLPISHRVPGSDAEVEGTPKALGDTRPPSGPEPLSVEKRDLNPHDFEALYRSDHP